MTEITVTIEDGADSQLIRRIFENVKGVVKTSVIHRRKPEDTKAQEWLNMLHSIKEEVDPSVIDLEDED